MIKYFKYYDYFGGNFMLLYFVIIIAIIVAAGILNENYFKIPFEIALVLTAFILSLTLKILPAEFGNLIMSNTQTFSLDSFLMDGVLCFMLFAGASNIHFSKFLSNLKPITLLAFLGTFICSMVYGSLLYLLSQCLNLNIDIWTCILAGCVLSPTDPIAATSILNKVGLAKNVTATIEGESLFNDGTGVALFICFKNIVCNTSGLSLPALIAKELLGAAAVGITVSFLLFKLLRLTKNPVMHIFISILDVSLVYVICEHFGFSGVIAAVVCGMYFSKCMEKHGNWRMVVDPKDLYKSFWHVADTLLNSILFVLIGISILYIPYHHMFLMLLIPTILINLVSRYISVAFCSLFIEKNKVPNKYSIHEFSSLLTWSGLKGGLSLALALSCSEFLPPRTYDIVLIITYITIFFTTVFQGLSVAKILSVIEKAKEKRLLNKQRKIYQ